MRKMGLLIFSAFFVSQALQAELQTELQAEIWKNRLDRAKPTDGAAFEEYLEKHRRPLGSNFAEEYLEKYGEPTDPQVNYKKYRRHDLDDFELIWRSVCGGYEPADYYQNHPRYHELREIQRYVDSMDIGMRQSVTGQPYLPSAQDVCRQAVMLKNLDERQR